MRSTRLSGLFLAAGCAAALSACTSGSTDAATTTTATSGVSSVTTSASGPSTAAPTSSSPVASSPVASTSPTSSRPVASTPMAGPAACLASALHPAVVSTSGAAGTIGLTISLTNAGSTACTLRGFPGVSLVHAGVQVGAAATRDSAGVTTVTLPPGGFTTFGLLIGQALNYPAETCHPQPADGLRIYPPDSRAAIFLPDTRFTGCTSSDVTLLRVRPVGTTLG